MALIKCPECGKEISEYSFKCPHCGSENTSKKSFKDIDFTDGYENRYFTYAKEQMEAEMAAQEAAKEAAKRAEIAAQKAAAVEEEKRKLNQKRSRIIGLCLIVAIVIILIIVFVVRPAWQERKAEEQAKEEEEQAAQAEEEFYTRVQKTEDAFSIIEDAMDDEVTDEELQVSGQMQDYIDNGLTLFGDVNGQIEIELKDMKTQLWHIIFRAEDVTSEQIEEATNECIEIFGKDYEYEFLGYGDRYIWDQNSYKSVDLKTDLSSETLSISWTN